MSDSSIPSRAKQFLTGGQSGLKKGAIKVASQKVSKTIVGSLPVGGKVAERTVQMILLTAVAEMAERLPAGVSGRVGLTEDRRFALAELNRVLSGEILGRDMVDLVSDLTPTLVKALGDLGSISTEEIREDAEAMVDGTEQHSKAD